MDDPKKLDEQAYAWVWKLVNEQLKTFGGAVVSAELVWFRNLLFALLKSAILEYRLRRANLKTFSRQNMAWDDATGLS